MEFTALRQEYELLKQDRSALDDVFTLLERYVLPYRAYFNGPVDSANQISWRRQEIYSGTAVLSCQTLAANIHSNLTNPVTRWFSITSKNKRMLQINEVKRWLEYYTNIVYQLLQTSNFELQVNETYLDVVGFGTAIILEEVVEKANGRLDSLYFTTIPIEECVFKTDHRERLSGLFRVLNWTPGQIVAKFGYDDMPKKIKDAYDDPKKSTERFQVLFSLYKRPEVDEEWAQSQRLLAPDSRPWAADYHLYADGELLSSSGYYDLPAFAPRWRKASGSDWGFSQGMVVLSDILSLNKFIELGLKVGEKVLDPPALVTKRGIFGSVHLESGGVTVVDNKENVSYLQYAGKYDIAMITRDDLVKTIEKAFFVDQLQLKESPAMTATEVQVRYQLMQRLLGPTLGRLQNDFLDPLIERTSRIAYRYGLIPAPPEILVSSGGNFEIEYIGPMARAQRFDTVASIERWIQDVAQMASIYPNALDVPDVDEIVKEIGYSAGVPARLIKSDSQIVLERVKRQKEQAQAQQMAMAEQGARAYKDFGTGQKALQAA